jgi:6-phosphogluconolactonase
MDPTIDLSIADDPEAAARSGADLLLEAAKAAAGGDAAVALSGGATPRRMHRLLASEPYASAMPWERIHLFWADERLVPATDPASNFGAARRDFIDALAPRLGGVHPVPVSGAPERSAQAYEEELRAHFRGRGTAGPVFDLIFLGVGTDGHTASLFPDSPVLAETRRWAAAVKGGRPEVWRVTLTYPALNRARRVVFLATGAEKADIVRRLLTEPQGALPAQRVRPTAGAVRWLLDRAAAGRLPPAAESPAANRGRP